jgi:hypothetical protein
MALHGPRSLNATSRFTDREICTDCAKREAGVMPDLAKKNPEQR